MTRKKLFAARVVVVAALSLVGTCGHAGSDCQIDPTNKSDCGAGLFCDPEGNGREVLKGNTYVVLGKCRALRHIGERCALDSHCEQPARCAVDQPLDPQKMPEHTMMPGHCR